jgi:hypothetical protein
MAPRTSRRAAPSLLCAAALLAVSLAEPARAQLADSTAGAASSDRAPLKHASGMDEFGQVPKRFQINLGGYLPSVSTNGKLSTSLANGTNINFNNQLGLTPNTETLDAFAAWRISKHNYVAFQYFGFGRTSTKTLADSIIWGGNVYHAGATVDVNNHVTYYGFSYRYYIWREKNWELGPGLGIDALSLTSSIALRVSASDSSGSFTDSAKKNASVTAPVPMLGLYADWEFVPRLLVKGTLQYIYINDIAGVGGHVSDDVIGLEWYPLGNFGLGGIYHYVGTSISRHNNTNGNTTNLNYGIAGPAFYVIATF